MASMLRKVGPATAAWAAALATASPLQAGHLQHASLPRVVWLSASLASIATGENAHGQIGGLGGNEAVVGERGRTIGLGNEGWALSGATAVNDKGEVV